MEQQARVRVALQRQVLLLLVLGWLAQALPLAPVRLGVLRQLQALRLILALLVLVGRLAGARVQKPAAQRLVLKRIGLREMR